MLIFHHLLTIFQSFPILNIDCTPSVKTLEKWVFSNFRAFYFLKSWVIEFKTPIFDLKLIRLINSKTSLIHSTHKHIATEKRKIARSPK